MERADLIEKFLMQTDAMARIGITKHRRGHLPHDIPTHAQLCVLITLARHGSETVKDISTQLTMTSSAATQLVNGLVKAGLLMRKSDQEDRRKTCIDLTVKGKKILKKAQDHRLHRIVESFAPLSTKEIQQLLSIQAKIVAHWKHLCYTKQAK